MKHGDIDVVRSGILIKFATKLGSGSSGISTRRNLNQSSTLPTTTTRVVGTPQMVFTNPITTNHVNRTTYQPTMSSIDVGGYRSADGVNPRVGCQKPFVVTTQIFDHKYGHYVRLNMVAFKYFDFFLMLIQMLMLEYLIM